MTQGKGWGAEFSKERYVWIIVSAALLTVFVILLFKYVHCGEQLAVAKRESETLQAKLDAVSCGSLLPSGDIAHLNKQGISRLEEDLASDLMQHRELIPFEGIMGGTMGFYSSKDIHMLSSRWVLASFEDGHIGGHMLLEYKVDPGGRIHWRVLSAYLN